MLLIGQLGAGKTTLAKGIVKGLGAAQPDDVSSPTFTLIHEYSPPDAAVHDMSREGAVSITSICTGWIRPPKWRPSAWMKFSTVAPWS